MVSSSSSHISLRRKGQPVKCQKAYRDTCKYYQSQQIYVYDRTHYYTGYNIGLTDLK